MKNVNSQIFKNLCLVFSLVFVMCISNATDYFTNPSTGSDSNNGLSANSPFRSSYRNYRM
ncbi:hypothetical protein [uncultured Winogradskyella sp.]|uniref:hypothetical protein n=1 Tax=uncultured Winogradskyella sp. TaxID=395353 RepID=UPI00260E889B|nr:hypothetical protein [uncultured Winogradskyella sp.]